jgi:thymidylate synthase
MPFVADTANDLYVEVLAELMTTGDHAAPRGMPTREIRGASMILTDPTHNLITVRKLNIRFAVAEFLWIITGQNRLDFISKFNGEIAKFSDDGEHMSGAYGPPLTDQLPWVIRKLEDQEDTRQALLTIWRPMPAGSKDVPCTITMQFMLRNNLLEMITYMRSNDMWLGFPYDLFAFTMIQRYVANALQVKAGPYHHHVGSLHLYDRDNEAAEKALDSPHHVIDTADLIPYYPWPPVVLEALIAAPNEVHRLYTEDHGDTTWFNIISLLIPSYSSANPKWREILETHGIEPRNFGALL